MKIALMTNNYKPFIGGVPISVERLALGLTSLGHQVTVFAPSYKDDTDQGKLHVVRYSSLLQKFIGGIVLPNPLDPAIEEEFKRQDFDVIHVHHPMLIGKTAVYLSRKYRIPLVFTYHTRYEQYVKSYTKGLLNMDRIMPLYLRPFLRHCSQIIAPTKSIHTYLTESLKLDPDKVSILPTGIEEKHFRVTKEECSLFRRDRQACDIPLFLTVSRMAEEKNVVFLLKSIAAFKKRYGKPFQVLLVGDGPDRAYYEQQCNELDISKEAVFTGKIPNEEIAPYYSAADAFLFASKTETQGIVVLEAFGGATPVVALDATGVRDLVKDGENGFLCPEETGYFAGKMLSLVQNTALLQKLSQNALSSAAEYGEEAVAKKAIAIYNKVIANYQSNAYKSDRKERALQWTENITF